MKEEQLEHFKEVCGGIEIQLNNINQLNIKTQSMINKKQDRQTLKYLQ